MINIEESKLGAIETPLTAVSTGVILSVVSTEKLDSSLLEFLDSIGLEVGSHIEILHKGIGKKKPLVIKINDSVFALREAEAKNIIVKVFNGQS